MCRYQLADGQKVDVLPQDPEILGFSNRWYPEAFQSAATYHLPSGRAIRAITPLYFLATKLEAFEHRGKGDFRSKDIEDITLVLYENPGVIEQLRDGAGAIHQSVRQQLGTYARQPAFEDAVFGCFPGDGASQAAAADLLARIAGRR